MSRRRVVAGAAAVAWAAATAGAVPVAGAASVRVGRPAVTRPCSAYPRPGTTASGPAPANLRAQYGVLRRRATRTDRVSLTRLGTLPEAGIEPAGIRYVGAVAQGARVYVVPAAHLLTASLEPIRCVPTAQRGLWKALLPRLRDDYAHEALCLVIVYSGHAAPTCQRAPGTVAPFLYGPGTPGLGLAPDGVTRIALHFFGHATVRARVRDNFWRVVDPSILVAPCGVDWLDATGILLRTVVSCTAETS